MIAQTSERQGTATVSGIWIFRDCVEQQILNDTVEAMRDADRDSYEEIGVRRHNEFQLGIFFTCRFSCGENPFEFIRQKADELKQQFGGDYLGRESNPGPWKVS